MLILKVIVDKLGTMLQLATTLDFEFVSQDVRFRIDYRHRKLYTILIFSLHVRSIQVSNRARNTTGRWSTPLHLLSTSREIDSLLARVL